DPRRARSLLLALACLVVGLPLFLGSFLASSVARQALWPSAASAPLAPGADLAGGGVASTDRQVEALQERLRQHPTDQPSLTALGLAYLQKVREGGDPSFYPRAEEALTRALAAAPRDSDTLVGLVSLALARHRF